MGALAAQQVTTARSHSRSKTELRSPTQYELDRIGHRGIGNDVNFSIAIEHLIGKRLAKKYESRHRLVLDSTVNNYVNRIVQDIVRHSDTKIAVTVKVVMNDEVNAYNLPGGFIYVNSGLVLATDDEASLACMLAHEVAHVAARHGVKYLVRSARLAAPESRMKFYRRLEREADLLALEYVSLAGYDPTAFVRFFEKVRKQRLASITRDHPSLQERISRARTEIATILPQTTYSVVTTKEFDEIKIRLSSLSDKSERNRRCPN